MVDTFIFLKIRAYSIESVALHVYLYIILRYYHRTYNKYKTPPLFQQIWYSSQISDDLLIVLIDCIDWDYIGP